ncbi:hypothetical protein [Micromonospora saelicesensis]|uniref:hypothetical protein n=1 Tax=Micromonospora saelicesensis TaxID=285676 RepID=UPI000DC02547|nr:hypothetical protein [Micromonospora saelicesensis]RAO54517.1 hypothetical protein PSN01_03690 [Micromonospora saelicesensis]RAO62249.1 hypothetical protein LUPAC06_00612 [Micromonospora saelicesensis]
MLTVSVAIGLAIQVTSVVMVHLAIRGDWMRRPGALMLLVAVLFHGVTEVMQSLWPDRNFFRTYVGQEVIDDWVLLVSGAIAVYACTYALVVRQPRVRPTSHAKPEAGLEGLRLPWLLLLAAPLLVATWQGKGAVQPLAPVNAGADIPERGGVLVDLAGEFLVPVMAILAAVVLVRWGTRWMLPVLVVESALLAMAGTRAMIVFAAVLTLVGAALHGVRPSRKQFAMLMVMVAAFTALISSTRAVAGREVFDAGQGGGQRLEALIDGAWELHTAKSREAILDDVVYRFDGNVFGALVYDSLRGSGQPVGLATVGNNLAMLVPSVVAPGKVGGRSLEQRSEEAYIDKAHGLSQHVDWLPTILGTGVAYYGPFGLILVALLLGLGVGFTERFALGSRNTTRVVLTIGLGQCALLYGSGPQTVITTLRMVVAIAVLMFVVAWLSQRRTAKGGSDLVGPLQRMAVGQRPRAGGLHSDRRPRSGGARHAEARPATP